MVAGSFCAVTGVEVVTTSPQKAIANTIRFISASGMFIQFMFAVDFTVRALCTTSLRCYNSDSRNPHTATTGADS